MTLITSLTEVETSRHVFRSLGLVTAKSRLYLGPLCLESRSRHCSDVGKAHRFCKYVMIFCTFFLSHSVVMVLFKFALVTVELTMAIFIRVAKSEDRSDF